MITANTMNQVTYLKQREGETMPELAKRIAEAHEDMRQKQPKIISRAEAKAQGLKYYFTGKPCHRGGIAKRLTSKCRCQCKACLDVQASYLRTYYNKNRSLIIDKQMNYKKENHETVADINRRYYERNRQSVIDRSRHYYENNICRISERSRHYRNKNKEKRLANDAKRRAYKREAIPSWVSEFDEFAFQQAYELAAERKHETGIEWHVDHMIPLRARKCCGLHCADNIQVIPAVMNLEKNNKMQLTKPLEWLK